MKAFPVDFIRLVEEHKDKLSPAAYVALTSGSNADEYIIEFLNIYYDWYTKITSYRYSPSEIDFDDMLDRELRAHPPGSALCDDDCASRSIAPPKKSHSRA